MHFELLPTMDTMYELYQKPRNVDRFKEYMSLLQGDSKGHLIIPLGGFNPMAKEHILKKLGELIAIGAEDIIQQTLTELNKNISDYTATNVFKVALTLSDDVGGAWTNRYTADYDSKFQVQALVKRNFCTPIFWLGENYDAALIAERTKEYAYRSIYFLGNKKPETLAEHVAQELYVAKNTKAKTPAGIDYIALDAFYRERADTTQYQEIFNFFYGDKASEDLEFIAHGIDGYMPGFAYCRKIASLQQDSPIFI